jgi:hypothetical protein
MDRTEVEGDMKLALVVLLILTACSSSGPVTVTRQGSSAPWSCAAEPALPERHRGGFSPVGKVTVELSPNHSLEIPNGRGVPAEDLDAVTDWIAELRAAYRSCRAVVDEINRLGVKKSDAQ